MIWIQFIIQRIHRTYFYFYSGHGLKMDLYIHLNLALSLNKKTVGSNSSSYMASKWTFEFLKIDKQQVEIMQYQASNFSFLF